MNMSTNATSFEIEKTSQQGPPTKPRLIATKFCAVSNWCECKRKAIRHHLATKSRCSSALCKAVLGVASSVRQRHRNLFHGKNRKIGQDYAEHCKLASASLTDGDWAGFYRDLDRIAYLLEHPEMYDQEARDNSFDHLVKHVCNLPRAVLDSLPPHLRLEPCRRGMVKMTPKKQSKSPTKQHAEPTTCLVSATASEVLESLQHADVYNVDNLLAESYDLSGYPTTYSAAPVSGPVPASTANNSVPLDISTMAVDHSAQPAFLLESLVPTNLTELISIVPQQSTSATQVQNTVRLDGELLNNTGMNDPLQLVTCGSHEPLSRQQTTSTAVPRCCSCCHGCCARRQFLQDQQLHATFHGSAWMSLEQTTMQCPSSSNRGPSEDVATTDHVATAAGSYVPTYADVPTQKAPWDRLQPSYIGGQDATLTFTETVATSSITDANLMALLQDQAE
eukprot:m.60554 g.60554  ORF g.60554 m.60554 type:complete len:449 (+) comp13852_c0_seq1:401-1747(+)